MAALRMVRRCGVTLATATAVPVLIPTVLAEEEKGSVGTSRLVRPTDLPIYENPEEVLDFEYHGHERTALEENIGVVRKEVEGVLESTRAARERVGQIYETSKAHSMATVDYITDEENVMPRAGAITIGGLAGLIIGARRRGSLVKKVLYTSTGVATAASLCYPRQAYQVSQKVYGQVKDYSTIGYNFVAGVKPQSKTTVPSQVAEEVPALDTSQESIPTPEGGEVRISHLLPPDKFPGAIDSLAQQASDVAQLGFRLTHPDAGQEELPLSKALEGFGSVGEVDLEISKDSGSLGKEMSDVGGVSLPESPLIDQGRDGGKSLSESVVSRKEASVVKDECVADPCNRTSSGDVFVEGKDVEARGKVGELDNKALKVEDEVARTHEKVEEVESKVSEAEGKVLGIEEKVEEVQDKVAEVEDKVTEVGDKTAEVEGIARIPEVGTVTEGVDEKITEVEDKVAEVVGEAVGVVEAKVVQVVEETTTEVGEIVGEFVCEEVAQVAGEKMGEIVKEKVTDIVENEEEKLIGEVVYDLAEKVTMVVEEKVAGEVAEVAGEVSQVAGEVAGVVHEVEEVGEKADSALTVVEEVVEMGVKAAEDTVGVPEALTEKMEEVEKVVEVVEQVANVVTTAAGQVEGLAEEVEEKAKEIKNEAKEIQGSEEKQEEIFEEIVDYAKDKLTEATEVKDKETASPTADVSKDMTLSMQSVSTESPVEASTQVTPVQESELATDAAARFGSIPEEQVQTEATEVEKLKHITEEEPKVDKESVETVKEASMEREGLINKLIQFFSKDKKSALEETPSEPVKESQSVIDSVSLPVTEIVNEPEKVGKVSSDPDTLKETTNVEMDNSEEHPHNIIEVLEPVFEDVTKEAVVKAVEGVVEEVSNIVKGATSEVAEYASDVVEVTDLVEAVGEKIISVMDTVQELTSDAIEDKDTPENVAAHAGKVKLVSEGVEVVAEKVVDIAEKVEEVAEIVKEKMVSIEQKIAELAGSEEKREELIEDAVDFVTSKSSEETASILPQELESETISAVPHESPKVKEDKQVEEETVLSASESLVKSVSESQDAVPQPPEPVLKKGLFSTLAQIFSKNDEEKEEHQDKVQSVEILTEIVEGKPSLETNIQDIKEESIVDVGGLKENIEEISDIAEASTDKLEVNEGKLDETTDTIDVSETPLDTGSKRDFPVDETSSLTPDSAEVTEEKILQEEKPSQMKQPTAEAADSQVLEREGLFDKLRSLFSKDKEEGLLGSDDSQESEATPESIKIPDYADGTTTPAAETVKVSDEILTPPTKSSEYLVEILAPDADQSEATVDTQDAVISAESQGTDVVHPQPEQKVKEGLVDKLVSLFSKDEKNAAPETQPEAQKAEVVAESIIESTLIETSDPAAVDSVDTSGSISNVNTETGPVDTLLSSSVETLEPGDAASETSSTVVEPQSESTEPGGLIGKLVSLFTKDKDEIIASSESSPADTPISMEPVVETVKDSDEILTPPTKSSEYLVEILAPDADQSEATVDTQDAVISAESQGTDVVHPQPEQKVKEGLVDKLVSLFSKDEKNAAPETQPEAQKAEVVAESIIESTLIETSDPAAVDSVDTSGSISNVNTETGPVDTLLSSSVETLEPGDAASETSSTVVEPQSESTEPGGLIGKLVSLFTKDKDEIIASSESSPADTPISMEPVVETVKDSDEIPKSPFVSSEPAVQPVVSAVEFSEPGVIASESTVEIPEPGGVPSEPTVETTDPAVDLGSQRMEKESLIDKIISVFSKDEEKKATVVTEPPETLTSELEQVGSSNVISDIEKVDTNIEMMPTNQLQISEPENSSESTETAPPSLPEKEKIINKIVNLFTKDEDKNEAPSGSPHPTADAVIKESVTELVDEPPKEKVETENIKEEASDAQEKVLAPLEKEGLFGKLANLLSSKVRETELREERKTQGTESREEPSTDPEAVKEEKPVEKASKSEISVETTPTPEELHRFTELSQEDKEHKTAEASDTSADSSTPSADRQEDSQVQFPSVTRLEPILSDSSLKEASRDAEPYLEIKDKSLFDRLDMLISVDESSNNDPKLNTSQMTAVEESPVDSDSQQKTQVKSTEETEEVMSSKLSKITKLFSSKETAKGLPTQEQREMASRVTEESSGKTGEDKITVVKTEAGSPLGEAREVQSGGPQDTLSPAWRGWLRVNRPLVLFTAAPSLTAVA
ncbi:hypothetical protein Pcinc_012435 [Petrolisthes cinctipes]|uniref:MICOS complex subunit n=1 Tax=Petrolisthes cinctipes TaxID=88211 RepID=A0AAE1G0N6_PETCI|nr:hypothetical protein Pcinc_012435 [Petrolisthes cinctipes]